MSEQKNDLAAALWNGYSGSIMVSDGDGGKLTIYYDNSDDADAAHVALAVAMDMQRAAAIRKATAQE